MRAQEDWREQDFASEDYMVDAARDVGVAAAAVAAAAAAAAAVVVVALVRP